ncbi:amino acid racemase [Candidatus Daviesbacteria bacterium]|nr:amino acid racemase [Candidatus Daviesbacteria bacterium]
MKHKKALYILGGMGPEASVYLYKLLIDLAISQFGAKNNDEFPEIVLYSVPVPDFISNDRSRNKALNMLKQRVKLIRNASCISIACNTAHILLPQLQMISKIPFVSMIDETVKQVSGDGIKKVGLMGTPLTIKYGLYQIALSKHGISTVIPSSGQIAILARIIRNVIKGKILTSDRECLKKIADNLKVSGAEAIILGCTELPLVFSKNYTLPVYNSVEVLAKKLLQTYYGQFKNNIMQGGDRNERNS